MIARETLAHRAVTAAHLAGVLGRSPEGVRVRFAGDAREADVVLVTDVWDADPGAITAAFARAPRVAAVASPAALVSGEWLSGLEEAARAIGSILVEPELPPGLAKVRGLSGARGRALLATIAGGAAARPLLFVPAARAPKNGLAKVKVDRVAGGWVEATGATLSSANALVGAALDVLGERAEPVRFDALLREARARVTASTGDTSKLAEALLRFAAREEIELYAVDPATRLLV
ncbi:MAG: hypothetical protein KF819_22085 [Labilithrix sp.]|nr:hypothetical protein [Labilithrix sp.]